MSSQQGSVYFRQVFNGNANSGNKRNRQTKNDFNEKNDDYKFSAKNSMSINDENSNDDNDISLEGMRKIFKKILK